jgi:hypothetical protein
VFNSPTFKLTQFVISGIPGATFLVADRVTLATVESGIVLVVTGKGETMADARQQAYDRVDRIIVPNMYYRDDIGERWIDGDGDRLQAWGYLGPE